MPSHYLNQCWQNCHLDPIPMKFHSKYPKKSFKKMHLKMVSAEQVLKQTKSWRLCNAYLLYRESTSTQRACNVKKSPIGFQHGPLWNADNSNWIFPCKNIPVVLRFFSNHQMRFFQLSRETCFDWRNNSRHRFRCGCDCTQLLRFFYDDLPESPMWNNHSGFPYLF